MSQQILATGTDRDYAAAHDWIKQTGARRKTLSPPQDEGPAKGELVAALLPEITSQHATAIVAQQIRDQGDAERSLAGPREAGCAR